MREPLEDPPEEEEELDIQVLWCLKGNVDFTVVRGVIGVDYFDVPGEFLWFLHWCNNRGSDGDPDAFGESSPIVW